MLGLADIFPDIEFAFSLKNYYTASTPKPEISRGL
jgi:hypothetical protein